MRRPLHQLDTTGATDGDVPVMDASVSEYVPGDAVLEIVEGSGVTVDSTDPKRPVVSATGGGGGGRWEVLMASDGSGSPLLATNGDWLYGEAS